MLPKNKLRNIRLARLRIFEDDKAPEAGALLKNCVRRFDSIVIPSMSKIDLYKPTEQATELKKEISEPILLTKATRQDDKPPLGSLGGLQPKVTYVPKVKAPKGKRKKPAPGVMKIFDAQGRKLPTPKWKQSLSNGAQGVQTQ